MLGIHIVFGILANSFKKRLGKRLKNVKLIVEVEIKHNVRIFLEFKNIVFLSLSDIAPKR